MHEVGFRSVRTEHDDRHLPVQGSLPAWLTGVFVRNGPGRFQVGDETIDHWFDGLAMLQRFAFDDGTVSYANRFLRTDAFRAAAAGRRPPGFSGGGGYLRRLLALATGRSTDNANVHIARLGGRYVALTETPARVTFDPRTLETLGPLSFPEDPPGQHVTAHLRTDPETGEAVGHATRYGLTSEYHFYRVPPGRTRRDPIGSVTTDRPAYVHSVGLTREHVVLVTPPFVVDPKRFLVPGREGFVENFEWRPERGTRWVVIDRSSGETVLETRTAPFFVFHHANAYADGEDLVVDLVAFPDHAALGELSLSRLRADGDPDADGSLRRCRISLADGTVEWSDRYAGIAFPRVAPERRTREYRFCYGQATRREGANGLAKVDVETGEATEWWAPGVYAEEPVFVPAPGADREDEGVVLATALEPAAERSLLLVLDADRFEERARAPLPLAAPFGFHGRFFPTA